MVKRAVNLFDAIYERDNLRVAFRKAYRGKRSRGDARAFAQRLEENLQQMAAEIQDGRETRAVWGRSQPRW